MSFGLMERERTTTRESGRNENRGSREPHERENTMKKMRLCLAFALGLVGCSAWAQQADYPNKPIRLLVGFAPGGAADIVARSMSEAFGKAIGQQVIVENKPGAGSSIAAEMVARARPDGYTLLIASPSSMSVNPALKPELPYTARDFIAVTKMTTSPLVLAVSAATNIRSVPDLIAAAKKDPGKLNYATSGNGSAPHLGVALFNLLAGTQMTHIPYKGGAPAIQSVMAGETDLTFGTSPSVLPQAKGGKLVPLAVSTRERSPLVPELPGMKEAGLPEYNLEFWYGMFVPAGTPPEVVKKIHDATVTAMQQPSVKAALARDGTEVSLSGSPEQFDAFLAEDGKFWVNLVKSANVKIE
jgi:tripartite-type tricarboxylate transporter receptor subunit TctC